MTDTESLIQKLDLAHARLRKLVGIARQDVAIYPNWRIKEFIDHLTGWDDAMISTMSAHLEGRQIPMIAMCSLDEYNQQSVIKRSKLDLDHSLLEWGSTRQEVIRLLSSYPPEKTVEVFTFPWGQKGDLTTFVNIFIYHEHEHADEVSVNLERGKAA